MHLFSFKVCEKACFISVKLFLKRFDLFNTYLPFNVLSSVSHSSIFVCRFSKFSHFLNVSLLEGVGSSMLKLGPML